MKAGVRTFSVFGDSISTLQGYNPDGYLVEYAGRNRDYARVSQMEDTWWGMVIGHFGGRLLANNSYSGSMVTRGMQKLFPSGCSPERIDDLTAAGRPDVLMIELGVNDWCGMRQVLPESDRAEWCDAFDTAYAHMLSELRARLPETEIWCLNLTYSKEMAMNWPADFLERMKAYNLSIARNAERYGARVIDMYAQAAMYTSWDIGHPDREGMRRMADAVIRAMEAAAR